MRSGRLRSGPLWLGGLMGLALMSMTGCSSPTVTPTAEEVAPPPTDAASGAATAVEQPASTATPDATQVSAAWMRQVEPALAAMEERRQALEVRVAKLEAETVDANRDTQLQAVLADTAVTIGQAELLLTSLEQGDEGLADEVRQRAVAILDATAELVQRAAAASAGQADGVTAAAGEIQALRDRIAAGESPAEP